MNEMFVSDNYSRHMNVRQQLFKYTPITEIFNRFNQYSFVEIQILFVSYIYLCILTKYQSNY